MEKIAIKVSGVPYEVIKPEWLDETVKECTQRQIELLRWSVNNYLVGLEEGETRAKEHTLEDTEDTVCRIIMIAFIKDISKQIMNLQPSKVRASGEYFKWRSEVFKRDNFTCQNCGKVGGTLNAHHIKPFAKYPELRLDINNGITLCRECHKAIHKKEGEQE